MMQGMSTREELDRRLAELTAPHEAGHAVVCVSLGWGPQEVWVNPETGGGTCVPLPPFDLTAPPTTWAAYGGHWQMIGLGGGLGTLVVHGLEGMAGTARDMLDLIPGCRDDITKAAGTALWLAQGDSAAAVPILQAAFEASKRLLCQHKAIVEDLAHRLLVEHRLEGPDVTAFVRSRLGGSGFAHPGVVLPGIITRLAPALGKHGITPAQLALALSGQFASEFIRDQLRG